MDSEQAKRLVSNFIANAKWELTITADYRLAGLLRDTWTARGLFLSYGSCVRVARFVLLTLPSNPPHGVPNCWNKDEVAAWTECASTKYEWAVGHYRGSFSKVPHMREQMLISPACLLASDRSWPLSLHVFYEEPDCMAWLMKNCELLLTQAD